jgi:integrase/predicted DNA-binding transcriptional regulator AlpA
MDITTTSTTTVPPTVQLLSVEQLCSQLNVSPSWVYSRTKKGAADPLPTVRGIGHLKFEISAVQQYIRARREPRGGATLSSSDGNARVNGEGYRKLTRKRFQTGSVRLREDRTPQWWEGFYREDIADETGKIQRKRKSVNLGLLRDVPTKRAALHKLSVILNEINDADYRPRTTMTFSGFLKKYQELTLPTKKGTTQRGYKDTHRKHLVPYFGDMLLCDIDTEMVQAFINKQIAAGYSYDTIKNHKWVLSAVFKQAVKLKYIKSNPVRDTDLPPQDVKEDPVLPLPNEINQLIEHLPYELGEAVWLVSITCIRPEELAFKWCDLDAEKGRLWIRRAVNRGKIHTPKYHRNNRPLQLTQEDVYRLLKLKQVQGAKDEDWIFPNAKKSGPICHEQILGKKIHPVTRMLGLPHITWRLLRHWGTTQMVEENVPIKAAQQRLGHSRPDLLLIRYAHVLDASAQVAAETLSSKMSTSKPKSESVNDSYDGTSTGIGSQTAAKKKDWVM